MPASRRRSVYTIPNGSVVYTRAHFQKMRKASERAFTPEERRLRSKWAANVRWARVRGELPSPDQLPGWERGPRRARKRRHVVGRAIQRLRSAAACLAAVEQLAPELPEQQRELILTNVRRLHHITMDMLEELPVVQAAMLEQAAKIEPRPGV